MNIFTQTCDAPVSKYWKISVLVFILLLVVIGMTGCGTQTVYVKQTEYVYTPIPKRLTKKCVPEAPVPISTYIKMDRDKKEETDLNYSGSLLGTISKCNDQLKEIDQFDADQQKLIQEKNDAAKKTS